MIAQAIKAFDAQRAALLSIFLAKHPESYEEIVRTLVGTLGLGMDPDRIVVVDHCEYQGTMVFVIGGEGYQPSDYWATSVSYGSCSGCDTLCGIRGHTDDPPTEEQAKDYLTLALHIVQKLEKIC